MPCVPMDGSILLSNMESEGMRNGRYFTDFTWNSFQRFIRDTESLSIAESWVTGDVRPGREEEKWLNLLLQKR